MGVAEPWDRGHGYVDMLFNSDAIAALQLDKGTYAGKNVSLLYFQGPIHDRSYKGAFTTGATFLSEIHTLHTPYTEGQMINTPSLVFTEYGKGRVLLSTPHPEETVPRLDDIVKAYLLWAARAI